jgi:3-oxoacyl-[acyl-carrier-protein] synthase II
MEMRRVVVTGMGLVSPLGHDLDTYWKNLLDGKSGIDNISLFDPSQFDSKIGGEVKGLNIEDYIPRREARRMDRFTHFAVISSQKAVEHSNIDLEAVDREQFGVVWGSGIGGMLVFEQECKVLHERGPRRVSPFMIPMLIPDIAPGHISIKYGLKGINYATVSACSSSAHAIGEAFHHICSGRALGMIAGGSEAPITQMGVAGFCSLKALSTRNDEPQRASRPFDKDRDGFVIGEGGGALILEELEHAKARNANIYAEITGVGYTADAYHITAPVPDGGGAKRAMCIAIQDGGIQADQLDYINAHGTSTQYNDSIETKAIKDALGEHAGRILISSTKSMIGHLLGASGVAESIATIMSMNNNKVHPTANLENPDPECDLNYVPTKPVDKEINYALCNSFGFGGHNVSLLFKKYIA